MDPNYLIITLVIPFVNITGLSKLGKVSKEIRAAIVPKIPKMIDDEICSYQAACKKRPYFIFRKSFWRVVYRDPMFREAAASVDPYRFINECAPVYNLRSMIMSYNPMYAFGIALLAARNGFPAAKAKIAKIMKTPLQGMDHDFCYDSYGDNRIFMTYYIRIPRFINSLYEIGRIFGRPSFMKRYSPW